MTNSGGDSRIDYIQMNVRDPSRSKAVHGGASGWPFNDHGPTYCDGML